MATQRQVRAAKSNIKEAQKAATRRRTIANLPEKTRQALGQQAARGRSRSGRAGHRLEDRNRQQLYALAREKRIAGRSKMGKSELIAAIRRAR